MQNPPGDRDFYSRIDGDLLRSAPLHPSQVGTRYLFDSADDIVLQTRPSVYRNRYPGQHRYLRSSLDHKHVGDWVEEQNGLLEDWTNQHDQWKMDLYTRRLHTQLRSSGQSKHMHSGTRKQTVQEESPQKTHYPPLRRRPLVKNQFPPNRSSSGRSSSPPISAPLPIGTSTPAQASDSRSSRAPQPLPADPNTKKVSFASDFTTPERKQTQINRRVQE
eukprot:TRINITY_DN8518_c0_g2_i2.p1 TRINITY_DN8518_c0_g2~~TRINITY_DN8518_c0_g2_i2.p1  ORF type:complete len:218 (+),score=41.26 TRINITY_DN8518_c0_g2_i2:43-696(+)